MGYGENHPINDRRSIASAVLIRVGTAHHHGGLITHITFVDADHQVVAGGETNDGGWKPKNFDEYRLEANQKIVGMLVRADNPLRAVSFYIAEGI